ncbi:MAG: hypothetical protein AAF299_08280, partial [Pseudomonadota bacterium]
MDDMSNGFRNKTACQAGNKASFYTITKRVGEGKCLPTGGIQPCFEQRPPGRTLRGEIVALVPKQVMTISPLVVQMLDWNMTGLSASTRAFPIAKALTMSLCRDWQVFLLSLDLRAAKSMMRAV